MEDKSVIFFKYVNTLRKSFYFEDTSLTKGNILSRFFFEI